MVEKTGSCGNDGKARIRLPQSLRPNVVSATMAKGLPVILAPRRPGSRISRPRRARVCEAQRAWLSAAPKPTNDRLIPRQARRISVARIRDRGCQTSQALDGLLQLLTHHDPVQIRFSRFGYSVRSGVFWDFFFVFVPFPGGSFSPGHLRYPDWRGTRKPISGIRTGTDAARASLS